jgi:penicillin-binding protein 2
MNDNSPFSNNSDNGNPETGFRYVVIFGILFAIFAFYIVYLFSLQVIRGSEYQGKARRMSQQVVTIPAQRGEIYDRNATVPMVLNVDSFAVDIVPAELPRDRLDTVFQKLSGFLGIAVSDIRAKVPPAYYHLYQPIEIKSNIDYATIATIAEHLDELPGVSWHNKPIRNYLETGSLAHVIGYVGDITKDELQELYNKGYTAGNIIGKTGVEKQYDSFLRGTDGKEYNTVDVKGKRVTTEQFETIAPSMGDNLVLSIDKNIQQICEKALGQRMGSVVVLKPATGEVLALVSYPYFDPNLFNQPNGAKIYSQLLQDPNNPFLDRAIQSSYPPASTFKIVMSTGIIEENAFPVDKKVNCPGTLSYGDRIFHCWIGKTGHGYLDLKGALAQSCDIYFWTVGRDYLGIERMVSYARDFGFGEATGIDLPGELSGFVPTPQWKEKRFHEPWLGGDTMNMSIGQGYMMVTPLQMADMVAMVVNEGTVYKPHILKEIRDPLTNNVIRSVEPEVLLTSRVKKETFRTVKENMRAVITEGTAKFPMMNKIVQIAGKTGTAEIGLHDHWHSWVASYAPYDAPDPKDVIAVVVMVEASNKWEWWSPYATNIIYQAIFGNQSFEDAVKTLKFDYLVPAQGRRE